MGILTEPPALLQGPSDHLAWAHPLVRQWFLEKFGSPTEPQIEGWPPILAGKHTLISAPTGSGKTLAAFLACIDRLVRLALEGGLEDRTDVLYVSPLKALGNDIQRNLEIPLREIQALAGQQGLLMPAIRAAVRTGDTLMHERRALLKRPPHILVTTPESLYILLTTESGKRALRHVDTVIVDEIHAVADDKRGAHLALSLERLDHATGRETIRIGLSATQKPIELVAGFLVGSGRPQPVIVDTGHRRRFDLAVEVPASELGPVASNEMWDEIYDRIVELASQRRSTLVFVNTRRLAERVAHRLAERMGQELVAAHHGSMSRKLRLEAERRLKEGAVRVLVATASLELGIDVGSIDLVCQVGSPRSIAVMLQRAGRAGHWRGATPKARIFATTRDELIECAALVRAIRQHDLDRLRIPAAPLDILAQQIVAACAADEWDEDKLFALLRRAYPYRISQPGRVRARSGDALRGHSRPARSLRRVSVSRPDQSPAARPPRSSAGRHYQRRSYSGDGAVHRGLHARRHRGRHGGRRLCRREQRRRHHAAGQYLVDDPPRRGSLRTADRGRRSRRTT